MNRPNPFLLCAYLFLAIVINGCSDSRITTAESDCPSDCHRASLRILLTDEPTDLLDSALVTISRAYLVPGDGDSTRVDLFAPGAEPETFDLLKLQDDVESLLVETPVQADSFAQLRLVVDDAMVSLAEGYEFEGGGTSRTLHIPSGQQSGIKVQLDAPIVAEEDMVLILVVDFDVNDSFVIQGNPDTPAGIQGILFTPVLKEKRRGTEVLR